MDQENNMKLKPKLVGILKLIISLTLIILILNKVRISLIMQTLGDIRQFEVLIAFLIAPVVIFLGTYKWKLMINALGIVANWMRFLISFLGGMGIGLLTPMRVGELSRILFLPGKREALLGIALVDKAIDLESLLILATLGSALAFWLIPTFIFGILTAILLGLILFPGLYTSFLGRIIPYLPYKQKIQGMLASIKKLPVKLTLFCLFIRLIVCGFDMTQFYILITAFTSVEPIAVFATYPLIVLVNTFPITISGIGLREGTAAILLNIFGIPAPIAVSASFILFCINTLLPGLIGALFINQASR